MKQRINASVGSCVRDSVDDSIRYRIQECVWYSVGASVRDSVVDLRDSVYPSVWISVREDR